MKLAELTYDELDEAIVYDSETGSFFWKIDVSKNVKKGTAAGTVKSTRHRSTKKINSYVYIRYKDREMVASRVAWMLHYREWPDRSVKFSNGDTTDLRISNLKLSNHTTKVTSPEGRISRRMSKDVSRSYGLRRYYGMSLAEYAERYKDQDGKCAICKLPETGKDRHGNVRVLAVDHCHASGNIRELLCYSCNSMLGQARDNVEVLLAGAEYLKKHSSNNASLENLDYLDRPSGHCTDGVIVEVQGTD